MEKRLRGEIEAAFNIAIAAPVTPARRRSLLTKYWGASGASSRLLGDADAIEKAKGRGEAGSHPIRELGDQEAAFYETLTEGQRQAYNELDELVHLLYNRQDSWAGIEPHMIDEPLDEWKNRALHMLASKPLEAFLLGQMFASEALGTQTHRPVMPDDRRAVDWLTQYTLNEVTGAFDDMKHELRNQLIGGIAGGKNPREVARAMRSVVNDHTRDWNTIAITETSRAESQGRLLELRDEGEHWVIGSSAHDPKTCPKCLEMIDGKKYRISQVIDRSNYGRPQSEWQAVIPLHPNCRCLWLPFEEDTQALLAR